MTQSYQELHDRLTAAGQMFEIETVEVNGVSTHVWKSTPRSLAAVLESSRQYTDRDFIIYQSERLSFEQHYRKVAVLARCLIDEFGITKGDRVAIAMRNFPEWSIAFWATVAVGAVAVPLNAWWTTAELTYGVTDSGARLLFADQRRAELLAGELTDLPLEAVIVARGEELPAGALAMAELIGEPAADATLPPVDIHPEDNATLFYTSGTTGLPKGTLGTHRNICSNVISLAFANVRSVLRAGGSLEDLAQAQQQQQCYLLTVPFFHVSGCHSTLLGMLSFGGKLVLMYKWDPEKALGLIAREQATTFGGVPTMVWQLLDTPDLAHYDTSSIKGISYGGAPAAPELLRRILEQFPQCQAANGYGLTECSSMVTLNSGADYINRPDSAGVPVPVCRVIAVDDAGNEVPTGELGELWISGPNVVSGYWNKPEANAESFTNGWFHSGDIGRIDAEGFVYVVDRIKDMVIRGGENVYCAEVESALLEHPAVHSAAVIGIPDAVLGEEVGAVVQVDNSAAVSVEALQQHVAQRLAPFKVPSRMWLRGEALPLSATGKVLKRELRDSLLEPGVDFA